MDVPLYTLFFSNDRTKNSKGVRSGYLAGHRKPSEKYSLVFRSKFCWFVLLHTDLNRRLQFCNWYVKKLQDIQFFSANIVWNNETPCTNFGIFNHHNYHYRHVEIQIYTERSSQTKFGFNV